MTTRADTLPPRSRIAKILTELQQAHLLNQGEAQAFLDLYDDHFVDCPASGLTRSRAYQRVSCFLGGDDASTLGEMVDLPPQPAALKVLGSGLKPVAFSPVDCLKSTGSEDASS